MHHRLSGKTQQQSGSVEGIDVATTYLHSSCGAKFDMSMMNKNCLAVVLKRCMQLEQDFQTRCRFLENVILPLAYLHAVFPAFALFPNLHHQKVLHILCS